MVTDHVQKSHGYDGSINKTWQEDITDFRLSEKLDMHPVAALGVFLGIPWNTQDFGLQKI